MPQQKIRLGTRASALAMWQANWTAQRLRESGVDVEIIEITTSGDTESRPLTEVGGEGLFTKRIQEALLGEEVDLAVHSLKDLPTEPVPELTLAAVPERADVRDVLITSQGMSLEELPEGAVVGTGSLRRQAQMLHLRPDLEIKPIRGNVDTRLQKLADQEYDAIVLAAAGIKRLELTDIKSWAFPVEVMFPAVGQGALGWETRKDDKSTIDALRPLCDEATEISVHAERSLLRNLRAGCLAPVGAYATTTAKSIKLDAVVLDASGTDRLFHTLQLAGDSLNIDDAESMGQELADHLLDLGASELIRRQRID